MTILPSPIPHPLDFSPWDLPGWAYEALEWVVGFDWPEGNEKTTWDIADQWYELASAMVAPRDDAAEAANQIILAFGGSGTTIEAFIQAWTKVADGSEAPLNALVEFANEMGKMVEECGCDIEGAKLEAWIEIGIFVIELIALAVTVALTLGAASPAAAGIIAATRMAIQQIFKRLIAQLSKKAVKQALKDVGQRVAKDLTTKQGIKNLGKNALREGFDEGREEFLTNLGIQAYQNSTGRRDGIDVGELAVSTAAGAAGGAAASGAGIGAGGRSGMFRGAAGEVLGELGGAAVTGDLPSFESLAKSASSGAAGSAVANTTHDFKDLNASLAAGGDLTLGDLPPASSAVPPSSGTPVSSAVPDLSGGSPNGGPTGNGHSGSAPLGGASSQGSPLGGGSSGGSPLGGGSPGGGTSTGASPTTAPLASPPVTDPSTPVAPSHAAASQAPVTGPTTTSAPTAQASPVTVSAPAATSGTTLSGFAPTLDAPTAPGTGATTPISTAAPAASTGTPATSTPVAFTPGHPNPGPLGATSAPTPSAGLNAGGSLATNVSLTGGNPATTSAAVNGAPATGGSPTAPPPNGISTSSSTTVTATPSPDTGRTPTTGPTVANSTSVSAAPVTNPGPAAPSTPAKPSPEPSQPARPHVGTPGGQSLSPSSPATQPGRHETNEQKPTQPERHRPDAGRSDPPIVGTVHASAHLTARTPDQARYEQAYFDQYEKNKEASRADVIARSLAPFDQKIATARRDQQQAMRFALDTRLDARTRAYYQSLVAYHQQEEQAQLQRRQQYESHLKQHLYLELDLTQSPDFARANTDYGHLSDQPIWSSDQSALTGTGHPPNARTLRPYNQPGGLRVPLALHQADLERVVPRDQNGVPLRTPDPRGPLLQLLNDGGSAADPTRGVNCVDCSLSFYETYVHGRPTVSAPRTVDLYTIGGTEAHVGETDGLDRMEKATGSGFTELAPSVAQLPPAAAKANIDRAFEQVARTLLQGGHGSTAILVNQWHGANGNGGWHAWTAVNHHGTLLFIDPQSGELSDATNFRGGAPGQHRTLYGHTGTTNSANVVALHALMVDGQGRPMAVPHTPSSSFSGHSTPPPPPLAYQQQQAALQQSHPGPVNQARTPAPPVNVVPPAPPPPAPGPAPQVSPQPQPPAPTTPVDDEQSRTGPPAPQVEQPTTESTAHVPVRDGAPPSPVELREDGSVRTQETQSLSRTEPAPEQRAADLLAVLDPEATRRDPLAVLDPTPRPPTDDIAMAVAPDTTVDAAEQWARDAYRDETQGARREFDDAYRQRLAQDLRRQAEEKRDQASSLRGALQNADENGDAAQAARVVAERNRLSDQAHDLLDRASEVERGGPIGDVEVTGDDWRRVNESGSDLAPGPVETGDRSALTGDGGPRPVDTTRRYHERGGLRPPLRIHQTDLERAMPRDADGTVVRQADPREGAWFGLVNDGGPEADPTRAINCGDTVLSLYDTWMHGRPRVSAPRTFDGYRDGDPSRPIGAEQGVSARIEATTGGRFEGLADVSSLDPQDARAEVRLAESRIRNHLLGLGHGSFAFITTQDQAGRAHAFAAINQNGTILYLDPQNRTVSDRAPMRTHTGMGVPFDVVRMDALTLDGQARHRPMTAGDSPLIAADPAGADRPPRESEVLPEGYTPSPALRGDPYHPDMVENRSTDRKQAWAEIPREVHETVSGIEAGTVSQRETSAGRDWFKANGNQRSPWYRATIFTGSRGSTTLVRVLVRSDGVVGFVTGHNYQKVTEYGYARLPQRYVAPPPGWS